MEICAIPKAAEVGTERLPTRTLFGSSGSATSASSSDGNAYLRKLKWTDDPMKNLQYLSRFRELTDLFHSSNRGQMQAPIPFYPEDVRIIQDANNRLNRSFNTRFANVFRALSAGSGLIGTGGLLFYAYSTNQNSNNNTANPISLIVTAAGGLFTYAFGSAKRFFLDRKNRETRNAQTERGGIRDEVKDLFSKMANRLSDTYAQVAARSNATLSSGSAARIMSSSHPAPTSSSSSSSSSAMIVPPQRSTESSPQAPLAPPLAHVGHSRSVARDFSDEAGLVQLALRLQDSLPTISKAMQDLRLHDVDLDVLIKDLEGERDACCCRRGRGLLDARIATAKRQQRRQIQQILEPLTKTILEIIELDRYRRAPSSTQLPRANRTHRRVATYEWIHNSSRQPGGGTPPSALPGAPTAASSTPPAESQALSNGERKGGNTASTRRGSVHAVSATPAAAESATLPRATSTIQVPRTLPISLAGSLTRTGTTTDLTQVSLDINLGPTPTSTQPPARGNARQG